MCMYCDRKDQTMPPPLPVEITGNMITPEATTAQVLSYRTRNPELVVTDYNYFTKDDPSSTGIGTVHVSIKCCPVCGRYLGAPNPADNKVSGISDKLRNELAEYIARENESGLCTDSDIENFIKRKHLSRKKAGAIWLQIAVWNAPDCCKKCKNVWEYPHCCCSRSYPDKFAPRDGAES